MKNKIKILAISSIAIFALGFGLRDTIWSKKVETISMLKEQNRPNIILIMADDMGYSDIGCYGGEIKTPNLDNLAANGLRFSQFYNTSRCCPTRASLLTGLYPAQTGIGMMTDDEGKPGYIGDLNNQSVTIAEVLKSAGYQTYMSGKWHVTKHLKDVDSLKYNWPRQRGFDKFYGTIFGAGSFWDPYTLARNNSLITPENDSIYQPKQFYYTDAISDNAVKYIQDYKTEDIKDPFFMYVAYTAAHWPLHAPEEEIEQYKGKYDKGFDSVRLKRFEKLKQLGLLKDNWDITKPIANWDTVQNKPWHARNMEVYAAMVTRMDKGIGNIISELEKTGEIENTLILFLQDNGACAEELEWVSGRGDRDILSDKPTTEPMLKNELQTEMVPKITRDGYPVVMQSIKVLAGSDQTYNAYGPTWANVSNTPFKKYKHWVNEGGISSPLIAYWPSQIKSKGEISHQPSHLIDIMATCVDVAEASYPQVYDGNVISPIEGKSLTPVLLNNQILEREAIYFEHEGNRAIRQQKWKLISKANNHSGHYIRVNELPIDQWELYDMENDRTENHDLAKQYPEIVKELSKKWHDWAKRTNTIPKPI
ncbi:arylsulfatase [Arenibacter echinorum]|uniref:Arylsulfatase n=1 Tax=Arenibacter echinorum TaxID=440515 RepID=A0A327R8J9_9FLAO|nr:arylsulfatase [Arenibacter echinorum]RAJ10227.1 arylsulfatase [Arenibacter echinorum]